MRIQWPSEFPGAHYLDEKEEQAALAAIRSRSLFRHYGFEKPKCADAFEQAACRYYGARFALGVNSCTGALSVAMQALDIGPGMEVIVPAFLWVSTVAAVVEADAIPVLCEVDDTFNMDPADLERKITPRTRLIVPVHMAGAPCDMEPILRTAGRHGIPVLEDCAQCNGGEYRGRKVGTFGRMGVFSFQTNKNVTAGEGGLILTDDEKLYHRCFSAHDMGMVRKDGNLATPEPWALTWGMGRRIPELIAAVAGVQLAKLPTVLAAMRGSKRRIKSMLSDVPGLRFRRLADEAGDTGPFLIMILDSEEKALRAMTRMREEGLRNTFYLARYGMHIYSNIATLTGKVPLSSAGNPWSLAQNAGLAREYGKGACPASDALFARAVMLPIPSVLTPAQEETAVAIIRDVLRE